MKLLLLAALFCLCSCVSYYEEYEQSYYVPSSGYTFYNAPLRIRGLSEQDFYMLDNYPGSYFNSALWAGVGNVSRFAIHGVLRNLAQ